MFGVLTLLALAGVAVGLITRPGSDVVIDRFDESFGRAATGQAWAVEDGSWRVRNGQLALADDRGPGDRARLESDVKARPALVTVDAGRASGELTVQIPRSDPGSGVVFRYRDPDNYWSVVAEPSSLAWWVVRVVDGDRQNVQPLYFTPADNARVRVTMAGHRLLVSVSDRTAEVYDPSPVGATRVGLIGGDDAARTRWDDLRFAPAGEPEVEATALAAADDFSFDGLLDQAGPDSAWIPASGAWSVSDGQAGATQEGLNLSLLAVGSPDVRVSADIDAAGTEGAGIVARYVSDDDHVRLVADPGEDRWVLESVHAGEVTELASVDGGPTVRARLTLDGPSASLRVGGVSKADIRVPALDPAAGYAGIISPEGGGVAPRVDNFRVRPLDPSPAAAG